MRQLLICIFVVIGLPLLSQPGNGKELNSENLKPFSIPYGSIQYKIVEGGEGSVIFQFDLNGMLSSTYYQLSYSLYGMEATINDLVIRDGDYQYIYNLDKGTGRKKTNKTESDLLRYKSQKETREALFSVNNGKLIGTETILEKPAEHWQFEAGQLQEAWIWEGIILKARLKKPRITFSYEATSIDLSKPTIEYPEINID
jgi:hypothetical protein